MESDHVLGLIVQDPTILLLFIPGLLFSVLTVWGWRGKTRRSRFWTRQSRGDDFMLAVCPGVSLMGTLFLAATILDVSSRVTLVATLASVSVFAWALLVGLVSPFWWPAQRLWGPRWYVRMDRELVDEAEINGADPWGEHTADPVRGDAYQDAMARAAAGSADDRRLFWLGDTLALWHGARLMDAISPSRRGAVLGDVHVCEHGVWFDAPGATVQVQDQVMIALAWPQITGARAVPGNANAAGVRVPGILRRSWLTRLVVETTTGAVLFEIVSWRAAQAAQRINEERSRYAG